MNSEHARMRAQIDRYMVIGSGDDIARAVESARAAGANVMHLPGLGEDDADGKVSTAPCHICGVTTAEEALHEDVHLRIALCPVCRTAAGNIKQRWKDQARREWKELLEQLPQMIEDVRAGHDMPTFYRGEVA